MADKKKRRRRKKQMTIPLALVAGFVPPVRVLVRERSLDDVLLQASMIFLGFDSSAGRWRLDALRFGTIPVLLGFFAHGVATKIGLNRMLGRSGIPFIRI